MNAFSINPNLVVVDRDQPALIKTPGEEGSRCHPPEVAAFQAAGRRAPLRHLGHPPNRNIPTILRLNKWLSPRSTGGHIRRSKSRSKGSSDTRGSRLPRHARKTVLATIIAASIVAVFFVLTFVAWRRYLWAAEKRAAGGHLPVQLDGCLWRRSPRERAASERSPVAHRDLQPLRRAVPASHRSTDSAHRGVADLRRARCDGRRTWPRPLLLSSPAPTRSWPWRCRRTTGRSSRLISRSSRPAGP